VSQEKGQRTQNPLAEFGTPEDKTKISKYSFRKLRNGVMNRSSPYVYLRWIALPSWSLRTGYYGHKKTRKEEVSWTKEKKTFS
jgi:hypothetical protein